ncbi:MAG: hypothetical protein KDA36_00290 [Planctomycetaceae bacterium]|nr:hypothetical protein [Planctomycetaceae bacterium]
MSLFPSLTDHPPRQACTIDPILPLAKSSPIASNTTPQGKLGPFRRSPDSTGTPPPVATKRQMPGIARIPHD